MNTARNPALFAALCDPDRHAAMETIRQLLEQIERLASDADLTEVAFLIGVALASLRQELPTGTDFDPGFGTSTRLM
jgi:hypothetical protein